MSADVYTRQWAEAVVTSYLGQHYPELTLGEVSAVELAHGWLVQAAVSRPELYAGAPPRAFLLMVNRLGLVEEMGGAEGQSQRRGTMLNCLRRFNEVVDLRNKPDADMTASPGTGPRRPIVDAASWSR